MSNKLEINTVTVVGANGVMGRNIAAIFASFGNAKVYLVSRSMEKSIEAIEKAYLSVRAESIRNKMIPSDYEHLCECVGKSDLIFEACAEDWNVKEEIHTRIANAAKADGNGKIFCSGTSGLSITGLARLYPLQCRSRFMGMHFFNPPYQMTLCEMTPTKYMDDDKFYFNFMKTYAEKVLYRTVVETADVPAFMGNRIGFQFINESLQMADAYRDNGGIDYIDAVVGPFTGRSMSPLVTADFVGLDVHKAIVENLYENTDDYAHSSFQLPGFTQRLVRDGKTGRKVGAGLYKTVVHDSGRKIYQVYDIAHGFYRERMKYAFPFSEEMVRFLRIGDYEAAFHTLVTNQSQEAKLCCELLLKYIIYSLNAATLLKCGMDAADDVMAAGFHWCPPLALLEAFALAADFEKLCEEHLEPKIVGVINQRKLLDGVKKSRYDYRKFLLAKK